jgi:hypothetical protein
MYGKQTLHVPMGSTFYDAAHSNHWMAVTYITRNDGELARTDHMTIRTISMPTSYKLFANITKNRLNEHLEYEMVEQCGFRKGRICIDAIFTVQQISEKRKEQNLLLFLLFIDY